VQTDARCTAGDIDIGHMGRDFHVVLKGRFQVTLPDRDFGSQKMKHHVGAVKNVPLVRGQSEREQESSRDREGRGLLGK